jgi:hypothetical protein
MLLLLVVVVTKLRQMDYIGRRAPAVDDKAGRHDVTIDAVNSCITVSRRRHSNHVKQVGEVETVVYVIVIASLAHIEVVQRDCRRQTRV